MNIDGNDMARGLFEHHQNSGPGVFDLELPITGHTRAGQETRFQILIPAEPDDEWSGLPPVLASVPRAKGELILVVDDDAEIREITRDPLVNHGYSVVTASDGAHGVTLFAD